MQSKTLGFVSTLSWKQHWKRASICLQFVQEWARANICVEFVYFSFALDLG
jgi:hypothetical protein